MFRSVFRLYRITAPDGRAYIGKTIQPLEIRWRGHLAEAQCWHKFTFGAQRLVCQLRDLGPDGFSIEQLASAVDPECARLLERDLIIQYGTLSPGGYNCNLPRATKGVTTEIGLRREGSWRRSSGRGHP